MIVDIFLASRVAFRYVVTQLQFLFFITKYSFPLLYNTLLKLLGNIEGNEKLNTFALCIFA
jgi:hypothetical protein